MEKLTSTENEFVLNWGIVCTGLISHDFCKSLKELMKSNDYHKIVAVAARKEEDAKSFAKEFNIPNYYGGYDKLFNNDDVNICYIGSINTSHKDLCIAALNGGKNVLCEKPMTMTLKEQEEVFKVAKEKNLFFMEGLWTRFFPTINKIKQDVANNQIGELKFLSSNLMLNEMDLIRATSKELGGGCILDLGVYPIQFACMMFNHEVPTKITCTGHLMDTGVDECSTIVLLYPGNRIAQLNVSLNCAKFASSYLIGDKGVIEIPEYSWCPTEYNLNGKTYKEKLPDCGKTNYERSGGFQYEAEAVRTAISQGLKEHPLATHDNSRLIARIMRESMKQLGYTVE